MLVFMIKRFGASLAPVGRHGRARRAATAAAAAVAATLAAPRAGITLSLDDPRWGHQPKSQERRPGNNKPDNNDGPPDLDQLWRDFNARLNRLFGAKRGGGDGGGPFRPNARGVGVSVAIAGVIAVLVWLSSGAFIVQEGQVGIVTTFGKLSHVAKAGFNWRWPAPFQAHETVNVAQVQTTEIGYRANVRNKQPGEALMLTADADIVDVQFSVQYKIKDPVAWVFNNREQDETVRDAAETVVRELVGKSKMDGVLYEGRDALAAEARQAIQQMVDGYGLGTEIVGVTMQSVQPPDQVAGAFEDVVRAQEERTRVKNEAQAYADDILPQAKGRAAALLQDAEGYRANVENTATGIAARFDKIAAEYAKAPAVTRDRMYLDTMQQVFSNTSKIMIDAKTGTNQIYLPLDRMLAQGAANQAALGSRSGPVMPAPQNPAQPMQPQAQTQAAPAPADGVPMQPPMQAQPQAQSQAQPQPQPSDSGTESQRTRDLRSRETGRERESR